MFLETFKGVVDKFSLLSRGLLRDFWRVSRMFLGVSGKFQECIKEVSMKCYGNFKYVLKMF